MGDFEELRVARHFNAIALEGSEVIGIAEFGAELLEELPVAFGRRRAHLIFEMALEIGGDMIVVDQCVVDIEEEDGPGAGDGAIHEISFRAMID
jgi:hypothetical protein